MPTFVGFDHVQLDMPEGAQDRARAFYCQVLGMQEPPKPARLRQAAVWCRLGSVELHLSAEPVAVTSQSAHPGIRVQGLRELADQCEAAGYQPRFDDRYPGRRRFYMEDPFGNRLEFLELDEAGDA